MTRTGELMAARAAAGLCRLCGTPPVPDRSLCEKHLLIQRQQKKSRDDARKAAGVCVVAGCGKKPAKDHIRCRKCHAEHVTANREWQRTHRAKGTKKDRNT